MVRAWAEANSCSLPVFASKLSGCRIKASAIATLREVGLTNYATSRIFRIMNSISVYKCLCDETRLRILNLLRAGPLCVCHVQEALQLPQSKVSKLLAYMKRNGLLRSRRFNNWTVYEIPETRNTLLEENLRCLQDLLFTDALFKKDRIRLSKIDTSVACVAAEQCCESTSE